MSLTKLFKGREHSIYYMDTDSIITDEMMDNDLVSNTELGKIKIEYPDNFDFGIFLGAKMYYLENYTTGKFVAHLKGVHTSQLLKSKELVRKDFEDMLAGKTIAFLNKDTFTRKFGFVITKD